MTRSIFHIRIRDFPIQTERLLDAELRDIPLAIVSSNQQNGTIVSLSGEARKEGLYEGLRTSRARKMSSSVRLLPYNSTLYSRMHHYIYKFLASYSPLVEPARPGQYYLDMTGMDNIYRNIENTGYEITKEIQSKVDLAGQLGISTNKLVSNISTRVVPETLNKVENGREADFLAPLQTPVLPAAREKQVRKIVEFLFLEKVRELQRVIEDEKAGKVLFADNYKKLAMESRGRDNSAVKPPQFKDHIIKQTILAEDTNSSEILQAVIIELAEQLAFELRSQNKVAEQVKVEVHYADGYKNTRKGQLLRNSNEAVGELCHKLFKKANYRRNRIRSVIVDASRLQPASRQINLFEQPKDDDISRAVDKIRKEYGFASIKSAASMLIPGGGSENNIISRTGGHC
jgi:DNA polymerase-4